MGEAVGRRQIAGTVVNPYTRTAHIAFPANCCIVASVQREFVDRRRSRARRGTATSHFPLTMINFSPILGRDTAATGRLRYSAARQGSVKSLSVAELASNLIDHREALRGDRSSRWEKVPANTPRRDEIPLTPASERKRKNGT